jgi:hypothetical protein
MPRPGLCRVWGGMRGERNAASRTMPRLGRYARRGL